MPTIGELIIKHNELLGYVEAEQAMFDTAMKPYNEAIGVIKASILGELQAQGVQNFKSEDGTAYQVTTMGVKVDNREAFLQFVTEQNRWDMLQAGVLKDPVKDFLDTSNGVPPPGIKVDFFTKCNIRRS